MSTLDVLVPYYGDPELMRVAMRSVFAQDTAPARVIVVDDGYPDRWLEPWLAAQGHPVTYVRHDPNLGARASYIRALSLATGDYVVFMGADDQMAPGFVSRALQLISCYAPAVIQPGVRVVDADGAPAVTLTDRVKTLLRPHGSIERVLGGQDLVVSLLRGNWCYFPSLVWHRATIADIGFRPFDVVQDLALLVDVVRGGGTMVWDPQVSFCYRRHAGSDSAVKTLGGARFAEERAYFAQVAADLDAQGWRRAAVAARAHWTSRAHSLALVPGALAGRDRDAAARAVRHALAG